MVSGGPNVSTSMEPKNLLYAGGRKQEGCADAAHARRRAAGGSRIPRRWAAIRCSRYPWRYPEPVAQTRIVGTSIAYFDPIHEHRSRSRRPRFPAGSAHFLAARRTFQYWLRRYEAWRGKLRTSRSTGSKGPPDRTLEAARVATDWGQPYPGTRGAPTGGGLGAKRGRVLPGSGHFPVAFKVMRPWLSQGNDCQEHSDQRSAGPAGGACPPAICREGDEAAGDRPKIVTGV
jgi:hypothetical protein